jgi:hypothetical protein
VGFPVVKYSRQYCGGRGLGVCFTQVKAGVICQRPFTLCADAGRHWAQGVDWQGAGLAASRFDEHTEQSQARAWGSCRYLLRLISIYLQREALFKAHDQLGI